MSAVVPTPRALEAMDAIGPARILGYVAWSDGVDYGLPPVVYVGFNVHPADDPQPPNVFVGGVSVDVVGRGGARYTREYDTMNLANYADGWGPVVRLVLRGGGRFGGQWSVYCTLPSVPMAESVLHALQVAQEIADNPDGWRRGGHDE